MFDGRMLGGAEEGAHGPGIVPLIKGEARLGSKAATEDEEEML
jgi:hypothetical protein